MSGSLNEIEGHLPLTNMAVEVLLAVAERDSTGYEIMFAIEERTGGRLSPNPGTLYRAIDRLAADGLLDVRQERLGGKDRRCLALSDQGRRVLAAESERLAAQVSAARALLGGTDRGGR